MVQVSKGCLNEVIIISLLEIIKRPFKGIILTVEINCFSAVWFKKGDITNNSLIIVGI